MGCPPPRRGRPPQMSPDEREALILDAAEQLLLDRGLQGLTMAGVAQTTGMSKRTLYAHFAGRASLMAALVKRLRGSVIAPLTAAQTALPLAQRLHLLLAPRADNATPPTALEILRAVVAEAAQHPDLADQFLEQGPHTIRRLIRAELDRGVADGEIAISDTGAAAEMLHALALPCPLEAFLSPRAARPDPATRSAHVARAIRLFLRGVPAL